MRAAARPDLRRRAAALLVPALLLGVLAAPGQAAPGEPGPRLETPRALLDDAVRCPPRLTRKTVLLVHGTSVTADENWGWNYVRALPHAGFDVCTVEMPDRSLVDIQTTTEYVVHAIRTVARRSGQPVSVVGLSQGALQPRWALKWWPDLRRLVDDYVSMAGTNRGSIFADAAYYAVVMDALTHRGPAVPLRVDRHSCTQHVMPHVDPAEAAVRTAEVYVTAGIVQSQYQKVPAEPPLRPYTRGATGAGRRAS